MDSIFDFFHLIIDLLRHPQNYVGSLGYLGLAAIIFMETGALIFFLPGDSILVVAGIYATTGAMDLGMLNAILIPCAIIGDAVSYQIGKRAGPMLFSRPKSRFFNPDHVKAAHDFYEKHGGKAIVIARFMPLVRTFVPVVAGIAGMGYRRFASYNVIGGAAWIASMTCLGYFLGGIAEQAGFPLEKHIEKVIIVVVFLSILPGIIAWWKNRRAQTPAPPSA
jgi:membrane-associated protein